MNAVQVSTTHEESPASIPTQGIVAIALITVAFLYLSWQWITRQYTFSTKHPEDWGHAFIVPMISVYAIWKLRDEILSSRFRAFWPGLIPVLVGIASYYLFVISHFTNHMFQGASLILGIFGVTLLLLGPSAIVPLSFPIGFLLLGMTISEQVMIKVTFILQNFAAQGGEILLNVLGFLTSRTGNALTITTSNGEQFPLNVAEACSGMRMVVAFIALGVTVAYFSCAHWWQRIALLCTTVPIAVLTNVVRVTVLGILNIWAPEWAEGEAHVFIGTVLLFPALLVFLGIGWILNKAVSPQNQAVETTS
ncbi:MAG: exosortase/archaeosortase family protein [Phycisphaerales bacterium JB043]